MRTTNWSLKQHLKICITTFLFFSSSAFAQIELTWNKGVFLLPENLARQADTPVDKVALIEKHLSKLKTLSSTTKLKPAVLMHGCGGISGENIEQAKLLAKMNIPVFLPSFYARPNAPTLCAGRSDGMPFFTSNVTPTTIAQRVEEFEFAVTQLRELAFLDSTQILATGHSMGGMTVARLRNPAISAAIITGWGCFPPYTEQTSKNVPQLAVRFRVDPFLNNSGACEVKLFSGRDHPNTFSVILDGQETHEVMHSEIAKEEIRTFVNNQFLKGH